MYKWTTFSIISVLVVGAIVLWVFYFQETEVFPDANLEAAIRGAINKPEGPIYIGDLEPLTRLSARREIGIFARWSGMSDLTGLEYCVNLQELRLEGKNISDISALAGLTNLQELRLWGNNISDISPLAGLINLQELRLQGNNISDISPVAGLISLQTLWLYDNNISDISSLVENSGLSDGDRVLLEGNPLSTMSVNVYIPQLEARGVTVKY